LLQPLSFEQLDIARFVKIAEDFERLWHTLYRQRAKIDLFLASRNPFRQKSRERVVIGLLGSLLDLCEVSLRSTKINTLRNFLLHRISPGLFDASHAILRSNRLWSVRYWEYPWAIMNAELRDGLRILDVGSGWSLFPMHLSLNRMLVTAVDTDLVQMSLVSPLLSSLVGAPVRYEIGDVTKLGFADNSFDRVFCISVLEHLEEAILNERYVNLHRRNLDVIGIGEMLRVLKPGGLLLITVQWSENESDERSYKLSDILRRLVRPYLGYLLSQEEPRVDWNDYWPKVLKLWQERFPCDSEEEAQSEAAAAFGIIMRK